MGKDVGDGIELTRRALAKLEDAGEASRREILKTVDRLSCRTVLHDKDGDVLLSIVSPITDGWSMTLIFNGEVMGWFRHIELEDFEVAPVLTEAATFAKLLRVCRILPEEDYDEFEECRAGMGGSRTDNIAMGRWLEKRMNRIARKQKPTESWFTGNSLLAEVFECLRYLSVAMAFQGTKAEMRDIFKSQLPARKSPPRVTVMETDERSVYGDSGSEEEEPEKERLRTGRYGKFFGDWLGGN